MNFPLAITLDGAAVGDRDARFSGGQGFTREVVALPRVPCGTRRKKEILKHKLLESELAGRDIGLESARVNWVVHHRAQWRRARRSLAASLPV